MINSTSVFARNLLTACEAAERLVVEAASLVRAAQNCLSDALSQLSPSTEPQDRCRESTGNQGNIDSKQRHPGRCLESPLL